MPDDYNASLLTRYRAWRSRIRSRRVGLYVTAPSWRRRHPVLSVLVLVPIIAALLAAGDRWVTASPCGPGMTPVGSPWTCVGLDLDSTPMRHADPLADLETMIANRDANITGSFVTIVLLEDLTPDPVVDSLQLQGVRHAVEGAITAAARANGTTVAGSLRPQIKLLLASFGTGADYWPQAVTAIEQQQSAQHIVAVTGIGQSLYNTRAAVAALSRAGLTTIGADVTANNMNKSPNGQRIADFFRVAPTNTNEVDIATRYIDMHVQHKKIMLVEDQNPDDSYAETLASAFRASFGASIKYTERYRSPELTLVDATRNQYMEGLFAKMHGDICAEDPDLIYFAGRGADLWSFLDALASGGACPLGKITIMTGDDASNIVGERLPSAGPQVTVLFTALATANEWAPKWVGPHPGPTVEEEAANYSHFAAAFAAQGFPLVDLSDGLAMMNHDAVLAAAIAARDDQQAIQNPDTVAGELVGLNCGQSVPGASGFIAFGSDNNPIDKVTPILQINPSGSVTQMGPPVGAAGPVDYNTGTCSTDS
jgi:ABC-type branched-subunit amino acid transport system substrate-binding protein